MYHARGKGGHGTPGGIHIEFGMLICMQMPSYLHTFAL